MYGRLSLFKGCFCVCLCGESLWPSVSAIVNCMFYEKKRKKCEIDFFFFPFLFFNFEITASEKTAGNAEL